MIKTICFDLDGVYFTPQGKKSFFESILKLGVPEERVIHVLYKSPQMLEFVTGKISGVNFWDFVRDYWNIKMSNQELTNLWVKNYEVDTEVKRYVNKTRQAGYKTCIASNNNPDRVNALNEKFDFLNDFDVVVFSYEVNFVKPQKEFFQVLIEKTGCQPEEIVYSDDNPERIQGAKELGIKVFVYEYFEQFKKEIAKFGIKV